MTSWRCVVYSGMRRVTMECGFARHRIEFDTAAETPMANGQRLTFRIVGGRVFGADGQASECWRFLGDVQLQVDARREGKGRGYEPRPLQLRIPRESEGPWPMVNPGSGLELVASGRSNSEAAVQSAPDLAARMRIDGAALADNPLPRGGSRPCPIPDPHIRATGSFCDARSLRRRRVSSTVGSWLVSRCV